MKINAHNIAEEYGHMTVEFSGRSLGAKCHMREGQRVVHHCARLHNPKGPKETLTNT